MTWSGTRVLVTGGAGFIGSHLVEGLVKAGAKVTVLDLFSNGIPAEVETLCTSVTFTTWRSIDLHRFGVIFHLAANAYVPPSVDDPLTDFDTNCTATLKLLDALRHRRWSGRLVYASSAAVYGNPTVAPVCENHPTVPVSPYGVGKLAAERYCAVFAQLYGLNIASLRLFSVYGPRQRKQVVWDLMCKLDADGDSMQIHGDGTQTRDFIYVADVVRAAMHVAEHADMNGEVYNVGSGIELTINALATELSQLMGIEKTFDYTGVNRPGDPERFVANTGRIGKLGYLPTTDILNGLRNTVEWFKRAKDEESL